MRLTRLVPLYAALILALACLGAYNQVRYAHQSRMIDRKAELHVSIGELRSQAALVRGPLAVGAWAREQGMVPAPEVDRIRHVAPLPAPETSPTPVGLEVRTRWR